MTAPESIVSSVLQSKPVCPEHEIVSALRDHGHLVTPANSETHPAEEMSHGVTSEVTIRQFNGDGVWRDETGQIWVQKGEVAAAVQATLALNGALVPEPIAQQFRVALGLGLPSTGELMKPGKYKNSKGVVLEVTRPIVGQIGGYLTLGGIWEAVSDEGIFGRYEYLVTEESMRLSGYEPLPEEEDTDDD